jgi:hypothetical protein
VNQKEVENYILDTIDIMIQERFKELAKFNYYIEAVVLTSNPDGTHNIEFNGQTLANINKRADLSLTIGDIVLVCVANGNFSNKFIDLKRP